MPNATWSAISSGGSNTTSRCSSGGGTRGSTARESRPAERACRRMPRSPNRSRTRSASIAANSPSVCTPSRARSPASSGVLAASAIGQRREEARRAARRARGTPARPAVAPIARRLLGRERPVGDARPHPLEPELAQRAEQHARRLGLAAVVARRAAGAQRAEPRPHDLHPGRALLDAAPRSGRRRGDRAPGRPRPPSGSGTAPGRRGGAARAARPRPGPTPSTRRRRCAPSPRSAARHPAARAGGVAGQRRDRPVRKPQHEAARPEHRRACQPTASSGT